MGEQTKLQRLAEKKYQSYRAFFTTEQGEDILTDLMKACHYGSTVVGRDVYETYLNEGKRQVLLQILETAKMTNKDIKRLTDKMKKEQDDYFN